MKIIPCKQGEPEWFKARLGIPTASMFSKILTPKTRKISSQADDYENRLVAEILTGEAIDDFKGTAWTDRGSQMEEDAVLFYEMTRGVETQEVGFVTNDAGTWGCSPDRLIGREGGFESKCPAPHTHVGNLLAGNVDLEHYCQVQGCIMICEVEWWDVVSYHDKITPSIVRVKRDEEFIKDLTNALWQVDANIKKKLQIIRGM